VRVEPTLKTTAKRALKCILDDTSPAYLRKQCFKLLETHACLHNDAMFIVIVPATAISIVPVAGMDAPILRTTIIPSILLKSEKILAPLLYIRLIVGC
jgi:hypothetical protein